jgi:NAD(P)-dependent dehydrogenase (short-subunit alcohol dehydrogenase family)
LTADRYSLEGKVAIVTGGGTGLGKVISLALARAGADLMIAARRPELINETAAEVKKLGKKAMAVPTDVTDSKQVDRLIDKTLTQFGRIDVLVSNAGIVRGVDPSSDSVLAPEPEPIWELSDDAWHASIETNLTGTFYCCRAVSKHMVSQKSGKMINMASMGGLRAAKHGFGYCASKAGVIMFTKSLAIALARHNIQVNCLAPIFIPIDEVPAEIRQRSEPFFPMGRFGKPQEVGPLAVFLASDASNYITGECFIIDGAASVGYAPTGYAPVAEI